MTVIYLKMDERPEQEFHPKKKAIITGKGPPHEQPKSKSKPN